MFCCIICWREEKKEYFFLLLFCTKRPPAQVFTLFFFYIAHACCSCSSTLAKYLRLSFSSSILLFLKGVWKKEGGEMYMYTYSNLFPEVFGLPIFTSWFFVKVVRRGYWEDVYWLSPTHTTFNFQLWSERERGFFFFLKKGLMNKYMGPRCQTQHRFNQPGVWNIWRHSNSLTYTTLGLCFFPLVKHKKQQQLKKEE